MERTRKNVEDSDGTLIITSGAASGGTLRTLEFCQLLSRPHIVIDASKTSESAAAAEIIHFVDEHAIQVLNIAGPRLSGWAAGYGFALRAVRALTAKRRGGAGAARAAPDTQLPIPTFAATSAVKE